MEIDELQKSLQVRVSDDQKDVKYVTGLSTILVATIQEAKDRISQIEYIFCNQLYPGLQKNLKCVENLYAEAKKSSDDEWKVKENLLLSQIEQLQKEKACVVSECNLLKQSKKELCKIMSEKDKLLTVREEQIEEEKEVQRHLCFLVAAKASDIAYKKVLLGRYNQRMATLMDDVEELKVQNGLVAHTLQQKNEEAVKGNELCSKLLEQVEIQKQKIVSAEEILLNKEKENQQLVAKLEQLQASLDDLDAQLKKKIREENEESKLQEKLAQKNKEHKFELIKMRHLLSDHEQEKKLLLSRLKDVDEKVGQLERCLENNSAWASERNECYKNLSQQINLKAAELLSEKQKRQCLLSAYKRVKSQYKYLLTKCSLTDEETYHLDHHHVGVAPPGTRDLSPQCNRVAGESNLVKKEISYEGNAEGESNLMKKEINCEGKVDRANNPMKKEISCEGNADNEKGVSPSDKKLSPISTSAIKSPASSRWNKRGDSVSSSNKKRPASNWRETRSRGEVPGDADPHDDFLGTPLQAIRENLMEVAREGEHGIISSDMSCGSSDDETQDLNAGPPVGKQQVQAAALKLGGKSYKYSEPVRKKAQRDNLRGIECKQCEKFYNAVLGDGRDKDMGSSSGKQGFRCEHHEGVSRHRYRYAPPLTPEGFWNIGFDSEI